MRFIEAGKNETIEIAIKAGLTTKDVTLVNLQPALALAAFTSGSVAAWDIWPPYVQQVVAQDGARVLATGSAYGSPYSFEVTSKAAVANPAKAAAIRVYLETLDKAYVWAASHPSSWAVAWGKAAGLPTSVMDVAAKLDATTPAPITSAHRLVRAEPGQPVLRGRRNSDKGQHFELHHERIQRHRERIVLIRATGITEILFDDGSDRS